MTEANYFSRLNKGHLVYGNGTVSINYPDLSDEMEGSALITYYLYAIAESASTATIPNSPPQKSSRTRNTAISTDVCRGRCLWAH